MIRRLALVLLLLPTIAFAQMGGLPVVNNPTAASVGAVPSSALGFPHGVVGKISPRTMARFLASPAPTVCGVGDSTWSTADNASIYDLTGQAFQQALRQAYPDKTITFKDFSFAGQSLSGFTTVISSATYPAFYTNHSATWSSYVAPAGCTMVVFDFGLNSAGYDSISTYQTVWNNITTWSSGIPDILAISNIIANPAAGTPYSTLPYQLGYLLNQSLLRTLAESGSTLGVSGMPPIGLIDVGRYFDIVVNGFDPVIQELAYLVPPASPVNAGTLATGQKYAFGTSPGGDFDLNFTVGNASNFSSGDYFTLTSNIGSDGTAATGNLFPVFTFGGGSTIYVQLGAGSASFPFVSNSGAWWNSTANQIEVVVRGARMLVYVNSNLAIDTLLPHGYAAVSPTLTMSHLTTGSASLSVGFLSVGTPTPYTPQITGTVCYSSQSSLSPGNGINHVASQCLDRVHHVVFEDSLPPAPSSVFGSVGNAYRVALTTAGYTVPTNAVVVRFVQASTVASATVTLPIPLGDAQPLQFDNYAGVVTAYTFSPAVVGWTNGSPFAANNGLRIRWDATSAAWQREE